MYKQNHVVVLLHGLGRDRQIMARLEKALSHAGFTPYNLEYTSTEHSIHEIAVDVANQINQRYPNYHVALVGHSLGGLVIRAMLAENRIPHVDRVVMLGTPNKGSEVATFLKRFRWYQKAFGKPGHELSTDDDGIYHQLPQRIDVPCAIIAGSLSLEPWLSWTLIPGTDDGKVSLESTKLAGSIEHTVVPVSHARLPRSPRVIQKVIAFLKTGHC